MHSWRIKMESKSEISRPELIAYTLGLVVVPFENVKAVDGDIVHGTEKIEIVIDAKDRTIFLMGADAKDFVDKYNNYLAFIEAATITDLAGGNDG